jgi:hypothetical protein
MPQTLGLASHRLTVMAEQSELICENEHQLFERPQWPERTVWMLLSEGKRRFEELDSKVAAVEFSASMRRIETPADVESVGDTDEIEDGFSGYPAYQQSPAWDVVDEELTSLVQNDDLIQTTHRTLIVGSIVKALTEACGC